MKAGRAGVDLWAMTTMGNLQTRGNGKIGG